MWRPSVEQRVDARDAARTFVPDLSPHLDAPLLAGRFEEARSSAKASGSTVSPPRALRPIRAIIASVASTCRRESPCCHFFSAAARTRSFI
jgi:hypothetical protein